MDRNFHSIVSARLNSSRRVQKEVEALREMMLDDYGTTYENESDISVAARSGLDFAITALGREVVAHYSVLFRKGENRAVGRYEFLLLPPAYSAPNTAPIALFHFDIDPQGIFEIDGFEGACRTVDYQRPVVRNFIVSYVLYMLQGTLTA